MCQPQLKNLLIRSDSLSVRLQSSFIFAYNSSSILGFFMILSNSSLVNQTNNFNSWCNTALFLVSILSCFCFSK